MPKKHLKKLVTHNPVTAIFLVTFLIFGLALINHFIIQPFFWYRPVVESPKTEMHKLPPALAKKVEQASPSGTFRVPIMMYHYVEIVTDKRDTLRQKLNVTPFAFEKTITTLQNAGYTFMTAKELGDVLNGKGTLPAKPILLTFDDGHRDFYTDVLPILKKYNVKATAYIIPGFTGRLDFMTKEQVQAVADSGLVDIGAHTVHHLSLKGVNAQLVTKEVVDSKTMLENTYNLHVVSFAYPNGSFDEAAANIVKNAGFTTSVSTIPGEKVNQENRYFLYRIRPGPRFGEPLLNFIDHEASVSGKVGMLY